MAFRKWKKPAVKQGSLLKTSVGRLEVVDILETSLNKISEDEALKAGFDNLDSLLKELNSRNEGRVFKIYVRYHSPDPRITLRQKDSISVDEFEKLKNKLNRLDAFSRSGAWTFEILDTIRKHPQQKASDLALITEREKDWLKQNIRKLKNLGLTISHNPGYTLSPRGEAFLDMFE